MISKIQCTSSETVKATIEAFNVPFLFGKDSKTVNHEETRNNHLYGKNKYVHSTGATTIRAEKS